jgi:peptide/nickel transport system ATP-binding protein
LAQLKVENLGVSVAGAAVVSGVSFTVAAGQRVGLIGETGAGKSLVALAVVGLLPAGAKLSGAINYDDRAIAGDEPALAALRGRKIGVVFQDAADGFDPLITIGQFLRNSLALGDVGGAELDKGVAAVLLESGLPAARAAAYPGELEASERQLLMVAAALAAKPDLLIADEPATGLDLIAERRVLDLIDRHCRERGMSLLLIAREIKAIALLCTRVVVLHAGHVVEAGEKPEIFGHPKHDFTRALLSAGRNRARTLMRTPIGGTLLDVRKVRKRYRRPDISLFEPRPPTIALDDVSFTMRAGESMGLVGPAGAGKTTLARIVAGLERTTKGELEFDARTYHGTDLVPVNRGDVTMIFPDPRLSFNPRLTLGESIAEPLRLDRDGLVDELSARIVEVVAAAGLAPGVLQRYPGELTLNELYRAGIARALVTRPKLVVVDEPVEVLDIASRGEMLVLLNRLRADFGLTFLVACRDFDTARAIADRIIVMESGRIVETGTPAQLLANPQHETTKRLVAAMLPEVGIVPVF